MMTVDELRERTHNAHIKQYMKHIAEIETVMVARADYGLNDYFCDDVLSQFEIDYFRKNGFTVNILNSVREHGTQISWENPS